MTAESATRPATAEDEALRHFCEDPPARVRRETIPAGDARVAP